MKRPEGRAPQPERAVYGASLFANQAYLIFKSLPNFAALKRAEARAPMRAITADVHIRRAYRHCSTAIRGLFVPDMPSLDFARCSGWRVSNALRLG